jgi:hypothetical protein
MLIVQINLYKMYYISLTFFNLIFNFLIIKKYISVIIFLLQELDYGSEWTRNDAFNTCELSVLLKTQWPGA